MDVLWYYTANMKFPGSNAIIPHRNAELERLFSIVKKKSLERSSMKLDGILSSILVIKAMYPRSSTLCYH